MVTRKIWLDANNFVVCEVERIGDFDIYTCPEGKGTEVMKALRKNGLLVTNTSIGQTQFSVDHRQIQFRKVWFELNQCSDLFDWFATSKVYQFTYHYDRLVFHCPDGFCAAYRYDLSNFFKI